MLFNEETKDSIIVFNNGFFNYLVHYHFEITKRKFPYYKKYENCMFKMFSNKESCSCFLVALEDEFNALKIEYENAPNDDLEIQCKTLDFLIDFAYSIHTALYQNN
jgi:hypothetical protein